MSPFVKHENVRWPWSRELERSKAWWRYGIYRPAAMESEKKIVNCTVLMCCRNFFVFFKDRNQLIICVNSKYCNKYPSTRISSRT